MGETSFKSLEQITNYIFDKISDLNNSEIEEVLEEISPMMSFDFYEPIPEVNTTQEKEVEKKNETPEPKHSEINTTNSLNESLSNTSSLNDTFKPKSSLAERLTNSKIDDLKSAIGINEKFAFITDLFAGSNKDYDTAISILNSCHSS